MGLMEALAVLAIGGAVERMAERLIKDLLAEAGNDVSPGG
jgi:hypothetical protein